MSKTVQLDGSAYSPKPLTYLWEKISGPGSSGNPSFSDTTILNPTATFTQAGTYVLRITATDTDGNNAASEMSVNLVTNVAPTVNAGPDLSVVKNLTVALQGSISDDGYPLVGRNLVATWSKQSGTGTVTFTDTHNPTTTVSVDTAGSFVLKLDGTDGALGATPDTMTLTVQNPVHYATATPMAAASALTDVECYVDLSRFDNTWWGACDAAGASVRVTDSTGLVSLPFDLVTIDTVGKTGFLVLKKNCGLSNTAVRIYCGGSSPVALPPTDTYGQYNAYNANTIAFYPYGRGNDRTRNLLHLTEIGGPTNTTGPLSLTAAVYGASKYSKKQLPTSPVNLTFPTPVLSISAVTTVASGGAAYLAGVVRTAGGTINSVNSSIVVENDSAGSESNNKSIDSAGGGGMVCSCAAFAGTWRRHTASTRTVAGPTYLGTIVNRQATSNSAGSVSVGAIDYLVVGARPQLTPVTFHSRPVCLVVLRNTQTDTTGTWKDYNVYQEQMLDQVAFWGTWTTV